MGQKIKVIIRSRNTHTDRHTYAGCLCPYMGRFILEAWRASAPFCPDYSLLCLFLLCVGIVTCTRVKSVSLGSLEDKGKDFGRLL